MVQVQPTQPVKPVVSKPVAKPVMAQPVKKPVQGVQPVEESKWYSKWWVWVIVAIVVIGAGVGVYFLLI